MTAPAAARPRRLPPTADRPTSRRESIVEGELVRRVKAWGGVCYKIAPTTPGLPDRLVIMPGGHLFLVEVKAEGGTLSPAQIATHLRLSDLDVPVHVVTGRLGVIDFMDMLRTHAFLGGGSAD